MEMATGRGAKGKGIVGLKLDGVRWVAVEEGVWEDAEARESWKRIVDMDEGKLRKDVKVSHRLFRAVSLKEGSKRDD